MHRDCFAPAGLAMTHPFKDRYGFLFWLRWIVSFAGSFIVSAIAWTLLLSKLFGPIEGEELMLTWTVSVFGTWFILVIPFMRKKEQIWKRLNTDQEKAVDAWLAGFGSFIGAFVASEFLWALILKDRISPNTPGLDPLWMKAVFSTWLVILIPLMIWMYRSADTIFKTANERQTHQPSFQVLWVAPEKRVLSPALSSKLAHIKPTLPGGHVVRGRLKNGEVLENLFVLNGKEIVGAYGLQITDFDASRFEDIEVMDIRDIPPYEESRWIRFNIEERRTEI